MFMRLPKAEAVAEDKVDDFVAATIGFERDVHNTFNLFWGYADYSR